METKSFFSWKVIALIVVVLLVVYGWMSFNSLVSKNEQVATAWAQVETQYQRRLDLIPNLVASVQGAMKQEQTVFQAIADARTRYAGAQTTDEKVQAANQVESSLSRLLVVMEQYPQLASIGTVQTLMAQLEGTENRISVERSRYNEVVRDYNIYVKSFPRNLIAGMFGYGPKTMFEAQSGAENAPKVQLN